jgi:Predicted integral membrane protein (DUF2269)
MLEWKTLHILSMITMITTFIGAEIFYAAAVWRRDVHALAFVQRTLERLGIGVIALGALLLGIVFGLLTAATGGFDYVAPWLVIAYVLVVVFLVNGFTLGAKLVSDGKAAMEAEAGNGSIQEVADSMIPNRGAIVVGINIVLFALIVADMVLKPSF